MSHSITDIFTSRGMIFKEQKEREKKTYISG